MQAQQQQQVFGVQTQNLPSKKVSRFQSLPKTVDIRRKGERLQGDCPMQFHKDRFVKDE